jgi:hypothetical protein
VGGGAINDAPQEGQAFHSGSSTILRQVAHRLGANGSGWAQNGQAATSLSMNFPQYGHGCL